ncbi:cell division cycle- protein [Yamadazyma tenuis]|uniref:cell division cycle- protein n=1 Tax=Candida tenuis TaxID=2315449 RepID=UPI00279B1F8C|nr:cell division cycle- protein [Yamadazyma tenuis]
MQNMSSFMDEIAPDVVTPGDVHQKEINQPLKPLDTVIALYDFPGTQSSHLPLNLGDTIYVLSKSETGWWDGVIMGASNGDLTRGWFPNNYVRSVNYVQPVLNKLKSNKELDSITAANTAANVLIPSFTNLLKKNLFDSEKNSPVNSTRKNSVVSFASSDASDTKSDKDRLDDRKEESEKLNVIPKEEAPSSLQTPIASQDTKFASMSSEATFDEVFSGYHSPMTPETLRFNPSFAENTENNEIKLTPPSLATILSENYRKEHKKTPIWIHKSTREGNLVYYCPQLDVYCENLPMLSLSISDLSNINFEIPSYSIINDLNLINDNPNDIGVQGNDGDEAEKEMNIFKRDSNVSINSINSTVSSLYHHFDHPLYSMDGLFYYHVTDIKSWGSLSEEFNYILNLSYKAVKENNKLLFHKHFGKLNKLLSILNSSVRLSQHDFSNTKYEHSIKRKTRRISSSFSQIYINSILSLSYMHYSPRSSKAQLFSFDLGKLNKSTSTNFNSISTTGSSISTIAQLPINSLRPDDAEKELTNLQLIEIEMDNIKNNLALLTKLYSKITKDKKFQVSDYDGSNSETSETEDDDKQDERKARIIDFEGKERHNILPQNYPRLVANEFNGGNWCNPFFESGNPIFNASGNDLKNKYHQKVLIDKRAYKSAKGLVTEMVNISNQVLEYLSPENQNLYYNYNLKDERNTAILRLSYKYLHFASSVIDLINSFDFTVFCLIKRFSSQDEEESVAIMNRYKETDIAMEVSEPITHEVNTDDNETSLEKKGVETKEEVTYQDEQHEEGGEEGDQGETSDKRFKNGVSEDDKNDKFTSNLTFDYPVVLEFFHKKQQLHYLITNIIMTTQSLTLEDPDVFRGIKDDDNPLFYNRDAIKNPKQKATILLSNLMIKQINAEKGDSISSNADTLLSKLLIDGIKFYKEILELIKSLIEERETIMNYATRVMHDDFNVQLLVIEQNNTMGSDQKDDLNNSFVTGKKNARDLPWYLEGDNEFDLLSDVKGNVKGGTKEALICHLTHHDLFDSNFNTAFLLTFASIMSTSELINYLILRFNTEAPEGLSYDEYNNWVSKKQGPVRIRVLNIMKLLLEKYWSDSYYNESLINKWAAFLQSNLAASYSISKTLTSHLNKLLRGEKVSIEREPVISSSRPPAPLIRSSIVKKLKLLDIDYVELARQLTIREFKLYSKITKFQCLAKVWNKKSGLKENIDSISNFIKASNQLTNFVAYMILRKQDIKKRVQIIRFFVQVAERCRQYNNFSSMTAIISALYSSPIHRLKKTWKYVSNDTLNHLESMNKLMNSSRNFNEYRDVLKFIGSESCVPFFGVYLSDLTFVFHGNPDTLLNRARMVNFSKRAKTADILLGLDRFKSTGYNLLLVPEIQKYLDGWFDKCPTIEEQYQLSLNLEPREAGNSGSSSTVSSKHRGTFTTPFPFSRT